MLDLLSGSRTPVPGAIECLRISAAAFTGRRASGHRRRGGEDDVEQPQREPGVLVEHIVEIVDR